MRNKMWNEALANKFFNLIKLLFQQFLDFLKKIAEFLFQKEKKIVKMFPGP